MSTALVLAQDVTPELIPAVGFMSTVFIFMRFVKMLMNKDWNGVLTQVVAWLAAIGAIFLWASSQWADFVSFNGLPLSKMNGSSLVIAAIGAASAAGVAYVGFKAIDQHQTAKEPPLFTNTGEPTTP